MSKIKISIVTVCYNAVDTIEETLLSVINQSYDNIEYIIIDGASKDGTVDIINKYADQLSFFTSEPDSGIYDAMNKGIEVASGEYINFMNAGDKFADKFVVASIFEKINPTIDIIYGDYFILKNKKFSTMVYKTPLEISKAITKVISKRPICHQATFAKSDYIKKHKFDLSYKICADWHFLRNAYVEDKVNFHYVNNPICIFDGSQGVSHDNIDQIYKERYKILKYDKCLVKKIPYEVLRFAVHLKKKIINTIYNLHK